MTLSNFQDFYRLDLLESDYMEELMSYLSIYNNDDIFKYYNMCDIDIINMYNSIDFFNDFEQHFTKYDVKEYIEYDNIILHRKPFSELLMSELNDIEYYMLQDLPILSLHLICSILYRQKEDGGILYEDIWEDYNKVNIYNRGDIFLDMDFEYFIGIINEFKQFRQEFLSSWSAISLDNIAADLDNNDITDEDREVIHEEIEHNKNQGKYIYDTLINIMSDGIPSEIELCYKMNIYEFFNKLEIKQNERKKELE